MKNSSLQKKRDDGNTSPKAWQAAKTLVMLTVLVMGSMFAYAQNGRIDLRSESTAEITHSEFTTLRAVFSYGSIESNEMVTERGTFSEIALSGTYPSGEIGTPELPATHQLLAVPFGATPHVSVISYTTTDYRLSDYGINTVMPRQPSVRKDQRTEDVPFAYNASAYQSRALATAPEASIEVQGTLRGIRIGSLVVNPVSYNASTNTLRVFNDIEVEVNFEGADYAETERMLVNTYSPYFDIVYKQMFNNRQILDVYSDHPDLMAYPVHMIVITPQNYVSTLQPWINWKIQKGFDVSVYTTSQTGSSYSAIRSYVQNLYNTGVNQGKTPTFLVLVGDVAQIPGTTGSQTQEVTDLYYGSVDSDYYPDMFYSRMSAENTTQLTAIVDKILQYEQYTMPDPSYLNKTTLIAGWDSYWNPRIGQPTINYATTNYYNAAHGFTTVNAHLNQSQYTGCYNALSSGIGFVNYTAHGSETSWSDPQFTTSNANSLTNTNKYFLAMGNCCLSGNFGYSSPCLGEAMIRGTNKGAYSYIGSCPVTYWYEDYYFGVGATNTFSSTPSFSATSTGVYDGIWMDNTYNTVSSMTFLGNLAVCYASTGGYSTSANPTYYWQAYHVLGDGSIMPYRVNPTANNVSHDSSFPAGATSFTVNAQAGSYVGISQNNTLLGAALVPASGSVNVPVTPVSSGTVKIVVTKPQRQPYIQDINVGGSVPPVGPTYVSTNPTNRNVILEEFTGRNCGYCPDGHRIANEIMAANPDRVWAINIHAGGYAPTSYPNFNTTDGSTIHGGFSISGYPTGVVNRSTAAGQDRNTWSSLTDTQLSQVAECNVGGEVIINSATRTATINVEVYYTGNSSYNQNYLTVAMLQDNILGSQSDYGNFNPEQWVGNQYNHMHVLRDVITESTWGEAISPTTQGSLITRTYTYQIPQTIGSPNGVDVDLNNIYFLAWVSETYQGTPTRPIMTACYLGGNSTPATSYNITASANPSNGGTVSGAGTFVEGSTCTLTATAYSGYTFTNWTKNGNVVSTNATYSFTVTENAAYVANFTATAPPAPTFQVIAEYYPDANDPYSPYVKVSWGEPTPSEGFPIDFENGMPAGWTIIDANNDGYTWCLTSDIPSTWSYYASLTLDWYHSGTNAICSGSYINGVGALTPDDYFVSPQLILENNSQLSFWAAATDNNYPADHFGVFVSTTGTDPSDFTMVQEWTLSAKREGQVGDARATRNGNGLRLGTWYQYSVDLSAYTGNVYIAFRHFDCNDQYIMCIDDISLSGARDEDMTYNVYRANCDGSGMQMIADNVTGNQYIDYDWSGMTAGNYKYGVSIVDDRGNVVEPVAFNNVTIGLDAIASASSQTGMSVENTGMNNRDGWYYYDNGINEDAIGLTSGGSFYWAVMFPAGSYQGNTVTKVSMYDYSAHTGNIFVYQGGDTAPGTLVGQQAYTCTGCGNFIEWEFSTPVTIDPTQNVWIVMSNNDGQYVASACANTGDANGRWISLDGADWMDIFNDVGLEYTWMVRAYIGENGGNTTEIAWSNCLEKPTEQTTYQITATVNPANGGTVTGTGVYVEGETCILSATANSGFSFTSWMLNGTVVSTNSIVSFTVYGDANYVANFTATAPPAPTFQVIAEYYPDANDPYSPYVKVSWGEPTPSEGFPIDFENGMPAGWTIIDANNDGYTWCLTSDIPSTWSYYASLTLDWYHSGTNAICSGSYINGVGALTPDDYFVSPQLTLENNSQLSFWAAATDNNYPADHFGVFVSTTGTNLSDFTMVQEWTLTAKREGKVGDARATRNGNGLRLGTWYQYSVDLSAYTGNVYIAFRHFDCNDQYIMCIDDISLSGARDEDMTYNVYRADCYATEGTLIAENITESQYIDTEWPEMASGNYKYGVNVVENGRESAINWVEPMAANQPLSFEEAAAMGIELCPNANTAAIQTGNRDTWNLLHSFNAPEGGHYGVVSDGQYIYTSNWGYSSAAWNFYQYDMEGNVIEGFNIDDCGTFRGMTYDGQYFYGVANSSIVYCVDLANHAVINTFNSEYGAMRGITYDPARDGFWVIGNWSGNLTLINRNGAIQFVGPEPSSVSDLAYYMDEDGVEHVFCFNNSDNGVYDYNITTNTLGGSVFNFSNVPGFESGSSGGCHVCEYNGTTAFFGDIQQSPNIIGIYEIGGAIPSGDDIIWSNCIEKLAPLATYQITATANPADGGTVIGEGPYTEGDICTLTATANEGYTFINWTENDAVVSSNSTYSFEVTGDRNLVANFTDESILVINDGGATNGYVPVYGFYTDAYLKSETVYPATELGGMVGGTISNMRFFASQANVSWGNAYFQVFLKEVAETSIDEFSGMDDATIVYEGPLSISGGVMDIAFATPYLYHGGNLLLGVYNTVQGSYVSCNWYGETVEGASVQGYSYSSLEAIAPTQRNFIPKTMFVYEEGTLQTYTINATAMPATGGTVTGGGTFYEGQLCTLTATANEGFSFINWTKNGVEVSTEAAFSFTVTEAGNYVAHFASEGYHWDVNVFSYPSTMTIIGIIQIDGVEQANTVLEIGAFCGDECRGRERLSDEYYSIAGHYFVFLTVYGNDGNELSFRLYDHAVGQELDLVCNNNLTFVTNATHGTPIEPYVFDFIELHTEITQAANFANGWNWWSSYVEANDLMDQMKTGLGTSGKQIKSQTKFTQYNAMLNMWIGQLNAIDNESTYMIETNSSCSLELTGSEANPADHEITLNPGWNWIGYPNSAAMPVATAFSNIIPSQGDQVKSQNGFSQYNSMLHMWIGNLNNIAPGMGLQYQSNSTGTITFVYPEADRNAELTENVTNDNNHWTNNVHAYPHNMTVTAVVELDDVELQGENYEVAAFANGECRGSARLMYIEPLNRYMAFLTIAGDEASELHFGLYDAQTGNVEMMCTQSLQYETNAIVGDVEMPYVISFRGTTGIDELGSRIQVFPNPVSGSEMLNITLPAETLGKVHVDIVNALGQVVETVYTLSAQTITAPKASGVYTLRITIEGKGTYCRKLVVK